jgi:hypothetical protein
VLSENLEVPHLLPFVNCHDPSRLLPTCPIPRFDPRKALASPHQLITALRDTQPETDNQKASWYIRRPRFAISTSLGLIIATTFS